MRVITRLAVGTYGLCLAAVACRSGGPDAAARARLASDLRDSLGRGTDPTVAFIADGGRPESHLYLAFDTTAAPDASDSSFAVRARDLARFAVRHYADAGKLDSITVATREATQPGAWRIHHKRGFAVANLK
jgi:hypothetical protein